MKPPDHSAIGQSWRRVEDAQLLTGRGRFVTDIVPEGCLHVAFLRSPVARGTITDLDVADAKEADGVVAVYTGGDAAHLGDLPVNPLVSTLRTPGFPILADDLNAVGQPVAAVVATTEALAQDALDLIVLDFEQLDPVLAGRGETLFPNVPDNLAAGESWQQGDVGAAFQDAAKTVSAEVRHARLAPTSLEPRAVVALWDERLTVWLPSQAPQRARTDLAAILGLPETDVRVIAPDVGGAFGMKASLYPEEVLVAWAAWQLEKPVRWTASRSEEFLAATQGRGARVKGALALDGDGRMLGLTAEVAAPLGHWLPFSAVVPARNAGRILPGPYALKDVEITAAAHVSNTAPVGIYRGAGRPEAALLMERLMDKAAVALNLDPADLRRRNLLAADQFPVTTPTGETLDQGHYGALLDLALARADMARARDRQAARRAEGELAGIGIGFYIEPSGQGWETARIAVGANGGVTAWLGSCAQGQGRETAALQMLTETLRLDPAEITVEFGDTDSVAEATGALASRSTPIGGSALLKAARQVRARLDAGETDPFEESVKWEAPGEAWGYGCAIAEVAIEAETGVLTVEQLTWVDDCGRIINPMLVEGQLMGGIAQGLGEAMMERVVYDDDGQLMTGSLMDYALPRAGDMPPITFDRLETPTDHNLLGARGVGEAGTIGTPAAILNAALDALAPLGVTDLDMPLTSETIWQAIQNAPKNAPEAAAKGKTTP